jgi:hypothetical protein
LENDASLPIIGSIKLLETVLAKPAHAGPGSTRSLAQPHQRVSAPRVTIPFAHGRHACRATALRATVIAKHRAWFLSQPDLVVRTKKMLRGKVLRCWCTPQQCHGDTLAEIANGSEESSSVGLSR